MIISEEEEMIISEDRKRRNINQFVENINKFFKEGFMVEKSRVITKSDEDPNKLTVWCSFDMKREEGEYVECPLEFERVCGNLGLKFGKNQSLFYSMYTKCWAVTTFDKTIKTKICKTPTPQDKLEVGKWYFCTDGEIEDDDVNIKNKFHLYLGYDKYLYVSNEGSVILSDTYYRDWYEVLKDEY